MKRNFICLKKSVRTLLLKLEPYFLSHAERGEPFQIQDFLGEYRTDGASRRPHFCFGIRFPFLAEEVGFEPTDGF